MNLQERIDAMVESLKAQGVEVNALEVPVTVCGMVKEKDVWVKDAHAATFKVFLPSGDAYPVGQVTLNQRPQKPG